MKDYARINGTPWHVGKWTRKEGDGRRHRSRCYYYVTEKRYCTQVCGECYGAAHCKWYKEIWYKNGPYDELQKLKHPSELPKTVIRKDESGRWYDSICPYPIGTIVEHKRYGVGKLARVKPDRVIIKFDSLQELKMFIWPDAFTKEILKMVRIQRAEVEWKRNQDDTTFKAERKTKKNNKRKNAKSCKQRKKDIHQNASAKIDNEEDQTKKTLNEDIRAWSRTEISCVARQKEVQHTEMQRSCQSSKVQYTEFQRSCRFFSEEECAISHAICKRSQQCLFYKKG